MDITEKQKLLDCILPDKIRHAKAIINQALERFGSDRLVVAWTGGKDSTTGLWLVRQACRETGRPLPRALFIDEGSVFDEILELVDHVAAEWNVDVVRVKNADLINRAPEIGAMVNVADLSERNRAELAKMGFDQPAFPFDPESAVGNHLTKTVPMKEFLEQNQVAALATAIRWDEQDARTAEDFFSDRTDPDHVRVHPILHFTERDIWNTIHEHGLPFCSLYRQGYRSLGAACGTRKVANAPAWEQDLENTSERAGRGRDKEDIMETLRSLGYM